MSLAQRLRARILAEQTGAQGGARAHGEPGGSAVSVHSPASARPVTHAASHLAKLMIMRLTHDLRRLKETASIQRKIALKREMLPEYQAWVEGLLAANAPAEGDDVLPTIMIWRIDTGDFEAALPLIRHVLFHKIPLPSRYERSAPALVVEEIAEAALKAQGAGERFSLDVLEEIDELTALDDMHDEIRAKLQKAIGVEMMSLAEAPGAEAQAMLDALARLKKAAHLHPRVGVTDKIRKAEKALAPPPAPKPDIPAKPRAPRKPKETA